MAVTRPAFLECDECGDLFDFSRIPEDRTAAEARARARIDGWKRTSGRDLCPGCHQPPEVRVRKHLAPGVPPAHPA